MRTAETIEQAKTEKSVNSATAPPKTGKERRLQNLVAPWPKGVSGNPGGKPKHDKSKEIAQNAFENNEEAIYKGFVKQLMKGNAYAFQVLADRAFGKISDKLDLTVNNEIVERLASARQRVSSEKLPISNQKPGEKP